MATTLATAARSYIYATMKSRSQLPTDPNSPKKPMVTPNLLSPLLLEIFEKGPGRVRLFEDADQSSEKCEDSIEGVGDQESHHSSSSKKSELYVNDRVGVNTRGVEYIEATDVRLVNHQSDDFYYVHNNNYHEATSSFTPPLKTRKTDRVDSTFTINRGVAYLFLATMVVSLSYICYCIAPNVLRIGCWGIQECMATRRSNAKYDNRKYVTSLPRYYEALIISESMLHRKAFSQLGMNGSLYSIEDRSNVTEDVLTVVSSTNVTLTAVTTW